jgi:uncharacterized surface protein with fasciclin (FAS1) repeats
MNKMKTNRILSLATLVAAFALAPNLVAGERTSATPASGGKDIVAVAAGAENFKTLVAAVQAAGLVQTLQGTGPFTVFAPTDEAFAKLPAGTVENLLKPENKDQLVAILKYHVIAGKVLAADVKTMEVKTVEGRNLKLVVSPQGVTVDNAKVIKTDVMAGNGVIHVIDTVLIPKA